MAGLIFCCRFNTFEFWVGKELERTGMVACDFTILLSPDIYTGACCLTSTRSLAKSDASSTPYCIQVLNKLSHMPQASFQVIEFIQILSLQCAEEVMIILLTQLLIILMQVHIEDGEGVGVGKLEGIISHHLDSVVAGVVTGHWGGLLLE